MRKYIYLLAMSLCMGLIGCGDDEVVPPVTSEVNPNNSGEPDKAKTICPDGNHPHAIDLGLPSGTKWCCCNVGAGSPEDCGGYYAWGETSEKSSYDYNSYAYYNDNTGYVNIGSDIAGTDYDVARVRMGMPWRMPSAAQQQELNNCSHQKTKLGGVDGILVTGRNGGQIFFSNADKNFAGSNYYWSSSQSSGDYSYIESYSMHFKSSTNNWRLMGAPRYEGLRVRAVCP